jgi:AmmeMemoRadiSam system protein A
VTHPYLQIARDAITAWAQGRSYHPPALPRELERHQPVFVSLHDAAGELRGCIGHLSATRDSIADEIATTAVLAASQDPRFPPVGAEELPSLAVEVSVLGEPEPVADASTLDPKRWGVVVSRGGRRGVLLPDLDGVDTVEQQLAIARRKASIPPDVPVTVERFAVEAFR